MNQNNSLVNRDGELHYHPGFIPPAQATRMFALLQQELAWTQESIKLFGKSRLVPRLVCWYGDDNISYRYSGVDHMALPWTPTLSILKQRLEDTTQRRFNSVLGNLYRNEQDSMGWHADNEAELGDAPFISSISLGEDRIFKAKHKHGDHIKLTLNHGSLLTMAGAFQQYWQHCVPKTAVAKSARINLTFRYIFN
ncbi:MAG: alpha-ketoglutarate-dependent dioxygenase AlkB [Gammaproteobacteria bacterium]|jgi:alkylated DNA repair dioxygenase AlkB